MMVVKKAYPEIKIMLSYFILILGKIDLAM
jgi:hypothetical protein